ncbi:MAG: S8 family serine peptidase [Bacilli bacterium]|nr:S8 family serine peptidase [Bacilli bacterium]
MKKIKVKILMMLVSATCMFCIIFVGCTVTNEVRDESQYSNGNVPLTDLASTYKGEATDADGNLLAPFDVVYPEAFESGDYKYDETAALLKFKKGFEGKLTSDLKSCGFTSLENVTTNSDGTVWYRAKINNKTDVKTAVKKARSLKIVLVADFDYIYEDTSTEVDENTSTSSTDVSGIIDDVLSNIQVKDQWYLTACDIQKSWRWLKSKGISAGGDPSVTVAVIDTGVDYNHPDLKANMWVNPNEIPGNGIDDDGDGYIDDVYGCSTISDERFHSGDPMDDHGHGTHVAGIIAASNNKIGTVGVAYNVKIMAIKAGQASGVFLQSDIAEAIVYAYTHGADVINMSFGGSACSIAVQDALQSAYTTSTLVASAGNDGCPNERTDWYSPLPNYPAALSYVIGVMSVNALGVESSFTNWDAVAYNSKEYEVYAPGEAILSTLPNNRYGKLNGTSMAAPIVSGIAALIRSYYTDRDMYPSKFVSAQLCATSEDTAFCFNPEKHTVGDMPHNLPMIVNAYDALTKLPKPDVNLYGYYLFDSKDIDNNNNGDGVIDAGETINIGTILRNRWGMSKNTIVTIDAIGDLGINNPYVEILTESVNFDCVGTYSTKDNLLRDELGAYIGTNNPLVVKVSKNCPNDYIINLNVTITYGNGLDEDDSIHYSSKGIISFAVRNGVILPSQITEDMTLTNDNYYIIPNSTVIKEGVTVTVDPGTKIQFWSNDPTDPYANQYIAYLQVYGSLITNGTLEEPVEIFPSELMSQYVVEIAEVNKGYVELNYTNMTNAGIDISYADHCMFTQNYATPLFKRYVDGGTIYTSGVIYSYHFNPNSVESSFSISYATNCVVYAVGGHEENWQGYNPTFHGTYNKCSFVDSDYTASMYAFFINCVFIGNENVMKVSEDSNKISSLIQIHTSIKDTIYNDAIYTYGEKSYVNVRMVSGIYLEDRLTRIRSFAKYLGGDICCIETEEEYNRLASSDLIGSVGLISGSDKWINGELVSDYVKSKIVKKVTMSQNNIFGKAILNCDFEKNARMSYENIYDYCGEFILELPSSIDWTNELLQEKYEEYLKLLNYNNFVENIQNCAILNNYNNLYFALKILAPTRYDAGDDIVNTVYITNNYWGTTNMDLINKQIIDYDMFKNYMDLIVDPILTTAPENTFPFVTDAYVLNSNGERCRTVSNETCTFVVEFNRDMDTTLPLRVRFGSSKPYAEYEISGNYVSPRRWEGVYTLKTTIENGNQYFNIENARAATDHFLRLYETKGRFGFEIDTTLAQAMIMQGEATKTGVKLTWQQDDFDTLLGYNVYRSDQEDGLYTRLNDYVLASNENEFFDSTVEPGKLYYYNFTVVKTDMTESTPSGKITIRAMDTMAPNIYHSPVRTAYTGQKLIISATITDNLQITSATLYFRIVGGEWKSYKMYNNNSRYYGIVGAENLSLDGLEYYIDAFDGVTHTYNGTSTKPYLVTVKVAVDDNSLGDVDGDGIITNKDALMLLQAANDKLNLTEEQFMRADINKDGILSAAEAMRILQYVSGKIGSIL